MKKYFKYGLYVLLGLLAIAQAFRPSKNINTDVQPNNINKVVAVSDKEDKLLRAACYDCHSNNTKYPWYADVMPVGWLVSNHVNEGKKHFNFDEFATYKPKRALHKLEEVAETVGNGSMPETGYVRLHKEAQLTDEDRKAIINWAETTRTLLTEKYKKDSIPYQ